MILSALFLLASITPQKSQAQSTEPESFLNFSSTTPTFDDYTGLTTSRSTPYVSTEEYLSSSPITKFESHNEVEQNAINPNCTNTCSENNFTYCEPEEFQHNYVIRKNEKLSHLNMWTRTRACQRGSLQDMCLLKNGLPLSRACLLCKNGPQWESTDHWETVDCLRVFGEQTITSELNRLTRDMLGGRFNLNDTHERQKIIKKLSLNYHKEKTFLPVDVLMTAQIFGTLLEQQKDASISADLLSVSQEIMSINSQVLRLSAQLNATNSLLSNFESYMDAISNQMVPFERCGELVLNRTKTATAGVEAIDYSDIGVQALISTNLSVFFANPWCDNITGIAIYSAQAGGRGFSSSGFWYRFLRSTDDLNEIKAETHLETAAFLPEILWQVVKAKGVTYIIFKVYAHDALFVETARNRSRKTRSKVISISIPELTDKSLPLPLPFLLRNENLRYPDVSSNDVGTGCGFWNYKTWSSEGVSTRSSSDLLMDTIIECHTRHLTQFAFLMGGYYPDYSDSGMEPLISPLPERILDIISIVGCCLSLLGALGIFLTAAFFKEFYKRKSAKGLLHICLPMCLHLVLFLFHNLNDTVEQMAVAGDMSSCVVLGAVMHYITLVLFSCMLSNAFLQYQDLVIIIGGCLPNHYILKSAIVAWSVPIIPTLIIALSAPNTYVPSAGQLSKGSAFCYPSGPGLLFGVILPVCIITSVNLCILVLIIQNISKSRGFKSEQAKQASQIRTSILLFFLLGLTWIFGVLSFAKGSVVFSYLFCITATMQGVMMFVQFVLLDKANRQAWRGLLCPIKKKMEVSRPHVELRSLNNSSSRTN